MLRITTLIGAPRSQFFHRLALHLREQDDIRFVGHAIDEVQILRFAVALRPSIVLLASESSRSDGIGILSKIRDCSPKTNAVMLFSNCTTAVVTRAIKHGARGCLATASSPEEC